MIDADHGRIKLDNYGQVIHPDLSWKEFRASDLPLYEVTSDEKTGYVTCFFEARINALDGVFTARFRWDRLHVLWLTDRSIRIERNQFDKEMQEAMQKGGGAVVSLMQNWGGRLKCAADAVKALHDEWLKRVLGHAPYEYDWGCIRSLRDREGEPLIEFLFKHGILDISGGARDIKSFCRDRRLQAEQAFRNE